MEKCTSEQHWVVASVTAVDAAFIASAEHFKLDCARVAATTLLAVALVYGVYFVWLRHNAYYFYRDALAKMLKDEDYLPPELRAPADRRSIHALSGILAYSLWVFLTSILALAVIWTTHKG